MDRFIDLHTQGNRLRLSVSRDSVKQLLPRVAQPDTVNRHTPASIPACLDGIRRPLHCTLFMFVLPYSFTRWPIAI